MKHTTIITRRLTPFILLFLALFLAACSSTVGGQKGTPQWIDSDSKKFPKAMYLVGQGMGDNASDAKDRARSDLAKQFEVAVVEQSQQSQNFSSSSVGGVAQQSLEQRISRQLLTRTSRTLEGVEIAEQWQNKDSGQYYALAILSRPRAQRQFEQKIRALDDQAQQSLQQAELENDNLIKAANVHKAIKAQQQRLVVQSSLQVVDSSGRGKPPTISLAELVRSRETLLAKVRMYSRSDATGSVTNENLEKIMAAAVAGAGFSHADKTVASYHLVLELALDPGIMERGWYWARGTVQVILLSPDGKEIGVQRWPIKASATTSERANQRLLTEIDAILKKNLRQTLLGFVLQ